MSSPDSTLSHAEVRMAISFTDRLSFSHLAVVDAVEKTTIAMAYDSLGSCSAIAAVISVTNFFLLVLGTWRQ